MATTLVRAVLTGALLVVAVVARADDRLWILTGDVYKDDYYFGGGLIIPFPRNHLGQGWVQRYWLDAFSYSYESNGQQIDANTWGAEAMAGYQASKPGLSGAAYLGVRYSDTSLSPDDPNGALRGQQVFPKGQLEGEAALSSVWRANAIAAYTFILDGYWVRMRFLRDLPKNKYIGPEVVAQGDPNYNALKLGVVFGGIQLGPKVFLAVKAGYRWQSGADSPYIGAELVGEF